MTCLTINYRKDPGQILHPSLYPAKFVEYSHVNNYNKYAPFTATPLLYLLYLLYAVRHTTYSTPRAIHPLLLLPFLNIVFNNLNALP